MAPKQIRYDQASIDKINALRARDFGWDRIASLIEGNPDRRTVQKIVERGPTKFGISVVMAEVQHDEPTPLTPTPPPPPLDPTNEEILRLEQRVTIQARTIADLNAKLRKSHEEGFLFEQAAEVIRESTIPLQVVKTKPHTAGAGDNDFDLVIQLSDEHADQLVSASTTWGLEYYDFNMFRCRLQRLLQQAINHVTIYLPAHKFHRCWVMKLGDAVNGDIHGSGPKNHFQNTIKAALATGDIEAQFIEALTPYFPGGVHVVAISGNHPRRSSKKDFGGPQDNFDYLVSAQIGTRLQRYRDEGLVSVHVPNAWTAFVEIRNRIWALNHGDDVIGFAGIPWYGFDRKNNRVQALVSGNFDQRIDYFLYGHYHTNLSFPSGGALSLHNGAFPMTDPYALEHVIAGKPPKQMIYTVNDERGITLPIPIDLRDLKVEQAYRRGEYEPELGKKGLIIDQITAPSTEGKFDIYRAPA